MVTEFPQAQQLGSSFDLADRYKSSGNVFTYFTKDSEYRLSH